MNQPSEKKDCCGQDYPCDTGLQPLGPRPLPMAQPDNDPCCGPRPGPPSSPNERPGYTLCHFVDGFVDTPAGPVPRVSTSLNPADFLGNIRARIGFQRDRYRIAPGLYCVGNPDPESPVLVSANYKLTFDTVRKNLKGLDTWLLVLDTRGINVWCAAGKKTFSTDEIIRRAGLSSLAKIVSHRNLILPQLGAPGVSAHRVKKGCGFQVVWGPVRAGDIIKFLENELQASPAMRTVTFTLWERFVLIPVELTLILKPSLWILLLIFFISGISPDFSFSSAWHRGLAAASAYGMGIFAGAVLVPLLLPWLPSRSFYIKGMVSGMAGSIALLPFLGKILPLEAMTLFLLTSAVSSYTAMNFTGATPFTSPSGVEKEMKRGIPLQAGAMLVAVAAWIAGPFMG